MEKGLIITLPRYDDTTEYLSQWSREIIEEAKKKNIKFKELNDEGANKCDFEKVVKKLDYKLLVFNGHGAEDSIVGYRDEILVEEGKNEDILAERITYSRSCNSAASLGIRCMKNNVGGCFIGYGVLYMFYINQKWVTNPIKDKTASLFLSSSNLVPISILKGNSCWEAHQRSKKQTLKNMKNVLRTKTQDSFLIAQALWNNYVGQKIIGNFEAKL